MAVAVDAIWVAEKLLVHRVDFRVLPASAFPPRGNEMHRVVFARFARLWLGNGRVPKGLMVFALRLPWLRGQEPSSGSSSRQG